MKAVVAAFNQEKALVGAFSVITNIRIIFGWNFLKHYLKAAPNTTVAIIESDKGRARQEEGDMVAVGEEAVTLVIHAESAEVTTSESSVPSSEQSSSQQSGPAPV